jgi:PilZ domain
MDKDFKKHLKTDRVVILTTEALIEGTIYHHQEVRLSDALNAPQFRDNPYLTLCDAAVTKIDNHQVIFRSNFLLVARSRILCVTSKSEVVCSGLPCLADLSSEHQVPTGPVRANPEIVSVEGEVVDNPAAPPSALKEKRSVPRRKASLLPVLITNGDSRMPPFEGWILDRSPAGLRLAVKRPIATGTLLAVRSAKAGSAFPWIKVEVRNSTTEKGNTNLGCRFLSKLSAEELQQFS